jgi:hypothetical protein
LGLIYAAFSLIISDGCEPRSGEASAALAESSVLAVGGRTHAERVVQAAAVVPAFDPRIARASGRA